KLRDMMLAKFKQEKYDDGLLDGVKFAKEKVDTNLGRTDKKEHQPNSAQHGNGHSQPDGAEERGAPLLGLFGGLGGLLCFGIIIVLVIWLVFGLIRGLTGMG